MSTTHRAAYLMFDGACTLLTLPAHASLSDEAMSAEALAEALRADIIDMAEDDDEAAAPRLTRAAFDGALTIGDWSE